MERNGQATIGAFLQSPGSETSGRSSRKQQDTITVLSDTEPEGELIDESKPVASSSLLPPSVIDLDQVESSEDEKPPKNGKKGAFFHPLFTPKIPKRESVLQPFGSLDSDTKPIVNSKGKGPTNESPSKLFVPPADSSDPVAYPLHTDIFAFDPSVDVSTATWPRTASGKLRIPYSFLTAAFVLVSATRGRLIITTIITNTLRTVVEYQPEVLRETVYLVNFIVSVQVHCS